VLVCGWHQNQINEIRRVSESVIQLLTQMLQADQVGGNQSLVLPGGGCWIHYLTRLIRQNLQDKKESSLQRRRVVEQGMRVYCETLERAALIMGGCQPEDGIANQFLLEKTRKGMVTFQSPNGQRTVSYLNTEGDSPMLNEDGEEIESGSILSSDGLDSHHHYYNSLRVSMEAVSCVLDVDGIIVQRSGMTADPEERVV
jgi:hypothetical protein